MILTLFSLQILDRSSNICSPTKTKHKNSSDSQHTVIYTMYVNSSGAENGSYSLTFLGKKVGRHRSVAPAGKQRECKTYQQLIN